MESLVICICAALALVTVNASDLARGFNDNINWLGLTEGLETAKELNKPAMILIHKSWCGACKQLKSKFPANKDLERLSSEFVMINIMDEEEPDDPKYAPSDAKYIPRIFFTNPAGDILTDVYNPNVSDQYKYFYPDPDHIYSVMQQVLSRPADDSAAHGGEL